MARDSQRRALLMTSPAFDSCITEVNRRARISKALAYRLGGNFQTQYMAELGACTSAHDLGEMSDAEFADCQSNGRSLAEVEKLQINRWSSATWQQGLLQNKQIPPVEVAKLVENGRDMATLISLQREQNQLLLAILENTKPATNAPTRNPTDTAVNK